MSGITKTRAKPRTGQWIAFGNNNGGCRLKSGEVWIDKNNMNQDCSILRCAEDGNVW